MEICAWQTRTGWYAPGNVMDDKQCGRDCAWQWTSQEMQVLRWHRAIETNARLCLAIKTGTIGSVGLKDKEERTQSLGGRKVMTRRMGRKQKLEP